MAKVFNTNDFIKKLKWLVNDVPNYYYSGTNWTTYDKTNKKWRLDCVVSIKSILWGFNADITKTRGGAVYGSNGVADFTCNGGLNYCTDVSQDFNNLVAGEYLCMKDTKYNHSGIYLGNGEVFECTTGWQTRKCIISKISNDGTRSLNGVSNLKWTYHGKLNYIDYSDSKIDLKNDDKIIDNINDDTGGVNVKKKEVGYSTLEIKKSITEIVQEVIKGKWKNYPERKILLEKAGYNYNEVQSLVNQILKSKKQNNEYILNLVKRTIRGDYGNGKARINNLGKYYKEVQNQVNLNYQHKTTNWNNIKLY